MREETKDTGRLVHILSAISKALEYTDGIEKMKHICLLFFFLLFPLEIFAVCPIKRITYKYLWYGISAGCTPMEISYEGDSSFFHPHCSLDYELHDSIYVRDYWIALVDIKHHSELVCDSTQIQDKVLLSQALHRNIDENSAVPLFIKEIPIDGIKILLYTGETIMFYPFEFNGLKRWVCIWGNNIYEVNDQLMTDLELIRRRQTL